MYWLIIVSEIWEGWVLPTDLVRQNLYHDHTTSTMRCISGTDATWSFVEGEPARASILMYHSVSDVAHSRFRRFTIAPHVFAEQMAYLYQHGYTPITVTQYIKALTQKTHTLPDRPVVLTFDDGFADFFTAALPRLKQYNFAATLYVATAFIGDTSRWLLYEREAARLMLNWEELTEISNSGIECGAHSHSHPQLDILPYIQAQNEIIQSRKLLEQHLYCEVSSFAYPFGYHTSRIRQLVREAGYTSACAADNTLCSNPYDPFSLARSIVSADMDMKTFANLLVDPELPPGGTNRIYVCARSALWRFSRRCIAATRYQLQAGGQSIR